MQEITYRIIAKYGDLSTSGKTTKTVCSVSWNNSPPVLDLRSWSSDGQRAYKGITLNRMEAERLRNILNTIDFDTDFSQ